MDKLFRLAEMWHCLRLKARLTPPPSSCFHTALPLFFLHLKSVIISTFRLLYQTPADTETQGEREAGLIFFFSFFCGCRLCNRAFLVVEMSSKSGSITQKITQHLYFLMHRIHRDKIIYYKRRVFYLKCVLVDRCVSDAQLDVTSNTWWGPNSKTLHAAGIKFHTRRGGREGFIAV